MKKSNLLLTGYTNWTDGWFKKKTKTNNQFEQFFDLKINPYPFHYSNEFPFVYINSVAENIILRFNS